MYVLLIMMPSCLALIIGHMNKHQKWTASEVIFAIIGLMFILFLQGAIPFLMSPCSGQALWTAGFAKSFTHGSFFTIYAHDFGLPKPAAISFGLAGAWPMSVFIRLGLHPIDAYSMVCLCWLSVAFFSAYSIALRFGNTRYMAALGAVVWMSLPIIWFHAHYGMLFLGMSLLPFYFLTTLHLLTSEFSVARFPFSRAFLLLFAAIVSVFMDGYTFVMFFIGSAILFVYVIITKPENRLVMWKTILPIGLGCFAIAYALYGAFIGKLNFSTHPIEVFRSYGVDLFYLVMPAKGMHWFADLLGYSVSRPNGVYFGDPSVWRSTFLLPLILTGLVAGWIRRKKFLAMGFFAMAVFAFYMSLGPSLKINSTIPPELRPVPGAVNVSMSSKLAVMSTGSAQLSKHFPGFNDMRAAYRWSALEAFAFWCLIMIGAASSRKNREIIWGCILFLLIIFELPHLSEKTDYHRYYRAMFFRIDEQLVTQLKRYIRQNEIVAFIPWGNDFMTNYLAPMSGFRTYNIGGDKNLMAAQMQWPESMLAAGTLPLDDKKMQAGIQMLVDRKITALVLPYFNIQWISAWPCPQYDSNTSCVLQNKQDLQPFIENLKSFSSLDIVATRWFTIIRLKEKQTHVSA